MSFINYEGKPGLSSSAAPAHAAFSLIGGTLETPRKGANQFQIRENPVGVANGAYPMVYVYDRTVAYLTLTPEQQRQWLDVLAENLGLAVFEATKQDPTDVAYSLPSLDEQAEAEW